MWNVHRNDINMPPLEMHQAASMLAASVDTILLPFRMGGRRNINNPDGTTTTSTIKTTNMSSLIRSIVGRRELNVASLLTRFEMPMVSTHKERHTECTAVDIFIDLSSFY